MMRNSIENQKRHLYFIDLMILYYQKIAPDEKIFNGNNSKKLYLSCNINYKNIHKNLNAIIYYWKLFL